MNGKHMLALWMEPPAELDPEFNGWIDGEHIPERLTLPGFLGVRRYALSSAPHSYLTLIDLADASALSSEAYQQQRANASDLTKRIQGGLAASSRAEYEPIRSNGSTDAAPYLLIVRLETEPEHEVELNRWYDEEHFDALTSVPGCLGGRRYRATSGAPKYLAVYELATADIPDSDAWHKAADTAWTLRMRPLFKNNSRDVGRLLNTAP